MLGSLISAGSNIIGGLLGRQSQKDAAAQTREAAALEYAHQKEFAQHGLTWKIDDALRNADKIHPIYSMGSAGASYSPVTQAFSSSSPMGDAVAAAGQNIGRAVHATATQDQRATAFSKTAQALALEKGALENDLLRTQLASENARLRQTSAPPFPPASGDAYTIPGQAQSTLIKSDPLKVAPGHPLQPQSEGGAISDVGYARTATGWAPVPSENVKQRIEDNLPQELLHLMRNNILPSIGMNFSPPPFKAPAGQEWHFHVPSQEYRLQPKGQGWWDRGFTVRDERK